MTIVMLSHMLTDTQRFTLSTPIGVVSDTHGLLRDEALRVLDDCDLILHLGDVGNIDILTQLADMAPLVAVRGNIDRDDWCDVLPPVRNIVVNDWRLHLVHDIADLDKTVACDAVLFGHSHKPRQEWITGEDMPPRLYFNPGSAGKRRFRLPITAGRLWVDSRGIRSSIEHLVLST